MRIQALLLLLFLYCFSANSQKPPIKYGRLDSVDLNLNEYMEADAVILCDYGWYELDGKLGDVFFYFTRHLRIKILTEEGLKYATHTIPFYDLKKALDYFESNQVPEVKAQTLTTDKNGNIKKTRLKRRAIIFSETDSDFNASLTFTFPDVQAGSVIEYYIRIPAIFMADLPPWYFQYDIPVLHSELRVKVPEEMNYEAKYYNLGTLDVFENKTMIATAQMRYGSTQYNAYQLRFAMNNVYALHTDTVNWNFNRERMQIKLMLKSASRKFMIPGMNEIILAMDPEYRYLSRSEKKFTSNSGYVVYYRPTLDEVPKRMLKSQIFGQPLNLDLGQSDTIKFIKENTETDVQLVNDIYDFVSSSMSWNGKYRVFVDVAFSVGFTRVLDVFNVRNNINRSLSRPLKKETGTSSEINFILINLLRKAGLKADPVLVSTQSNNVLDPEFFNLHQFNHVIVRVETDGNEYLLDAALTDQGNILETVPLNPDGLLIEMDEVKWIKVTTNPQ